VGAVRRYSLVGARVEERVVGMFDLIASRAGALQRLEAFAPQAGAAYAYRRNFDHGPEGEPETSRLSPVLQRRILSEEEVLRRTLEIHAPAECEKFAQEVVWRTYWKGWLEYHPSVWENYRRDVAEIASHVDSPIYRRAIEGKTGIEPFDQWRQELAENGFLHNHTRMWFASIWIFTLRLPWQLGAELFLRELLDADAASNTLSWRWVAGLHTRGKHYVARADNIEKYTGGRFLPKNQLNENPLPLTEDEAPPLLATLPAFTEEHLPTGKLGLLVHPEDFSVEQTSLGSIAFDSIALLPRVAVKSTPAVETFESLAERDVRLRLQGHFRTTPLTVIDEKGFLEWSQGLDGVVVMEPWIGSLRDQLARWLDLSKRPQWRGRRVYDLELIPHATKGYFQFRKCLPQWLEANRANSAPGAVRFRSSLPILCRANAMTSRLEN
jgi:deoxyribodipyrimidine photo-lyase